MSSHVSSDTLAAFVLVLLAVLLVVSVVAAMLLKSEGATWREILGWGWEE
jgi:hypothetical protein